MPRPLSVLLLLLVTVPCWPGELRIAVAANFKPALQRISADFESNTGHRVLLSSASTGTLYNQISHGAPFHLFFSADRRSVDLLQASGKDLAGQGFCYALGKLVLVGGSLAQLTDPELSLAIANPAVAPYGQAAVEILARPEFAAGQQRKLVRGNNAAQAYQFWYSGSVNLALLPASLASDGVAIPGSWHTPLEQYAVVLRAGQENALTDAYLRWLRSDTVSHLINEAGYDSCP